MRSFDSNLFTVVSFGVMLLLLPAEKQLLRKRARFMPLLPLCSRRQLPKHTQAQNHSVQVFVQQEGKAKTPSP